MSGAAAFETPARSSRFSATAAMDDLDKYEGSADLIHALCTTVICHAVFHQPNPSWHNIVAVGILGKRRASPLLQTLSAPLVAPSPRRACAESLSHGSLYGGGTEVLVPLMRWQVMLESIRHPRTAGASVLISYCMCQNGTELVLK